MKHKTLKEIYLWSMALLMLLILSMQLFYFATLTTHARKSSLEIMSFISAQLTNEIQKEISFLQSTASSFSYDSYISRFLLEENPANRYQEHINIYKQMRSLLKEHSSLTSILIYDSLGHRYSYGETFSSSICQELYEAIPAQDTQIYSLKTINQDVYFVTYIPIHNAQSFSLTQIGWAILLSRCDYIQSYLDSYSHMEGLSIMLADVNHIVFLSNRPESVGTDLSLVSKNKKNQIALSEQVLSPSEIQLTILQDNSKLVPYQSLFIKSTLLMIAVLILISLITSKAISHMIFIPLNYIISILDSLGNEGAKGHIHFQPHIYQSMQIVKLVQTINQMLDRISEFSHRAFLNQQNLYEAALREAKYESYLLRKQIDTHFIFNTLNSMKVLSDKHHTPDISQITEGLGNIIRYAYLPKDYINLFDEFQILEQYVYIMNVRYNNRFQVEYEVDDILCNYQILRQLIQPLLENSMTHAVAEEKELLHILIRAQILPQERFLIEVIDDGIGIPPHKLEELQTRLKEDTEDYSTKGISLINVNRRIQLYYGTEFHIDIESIESEYTRIFFLLPLQKDRSEER